MDVDGGVHMILIGFTWMSMSLERMLIEVSFYDKSYTMLYCYTYV